MKIIFAVLTSAFFCYMPAIAGERDYVADAFRNADFLPHVYDDSQIVLAYGKGTTSRNRYGTCTRTYRGSKSRWVSFSSSCDTSASERIVEEITVGIIPNPAVSVKYKGDLTKVTLLGISIGDTKMQAMKVASRHHGVRVTRENFLNNQVEEVMFFRAEDDTNLYYRFLISSGKVVALSIGVTE